METALSYTVLHQQNTSFRNTGGVSQGNRSAGFQPAFYDTQNRTADVARLGDRTPAPCHLLDGVPDDWVMKRDRSGKVITVKPSIVAGFIRNGRFYTREQALRISNCQLQVRRPGARLTKCAREAGCRWRLNNFAALTSGNNQGSLEV
jgi:hypothetical protein